MANLPVKFTHLAVVAALAASLVTTAHGTGFFGPNEYLGQGGKNVTGSPEFYWELEVKRLAKDFHPAEKLADASTNAAHIKTERGDGDKITSDADTADFAAALKEGKIKPPDPATAAAQHEAARVAIAAVAPAVPPAPSDEKPDVVAAAAVLAAPGPLPGEFDSEFADYHRGAYAYRLGKDHWDEACKAWEKLLARPEAERHYRTVWATFMLGKIAMKSGVFPAAVKYFQQVRTLAKAGFADSLGMAADSYGWEGRCEWKQGHPDKAAPLFLTQLALGDESAVVSLKALVPDRDPVEGMLNYGPEMDDRSKWSEQERKAYDTKAAEDLKKAAADPLLRRLVTAHILATETGREWYSEGEQKKGASRCARWIAVIKDAKPGKMEDAEYLGWVAYTNGNYKEAARWLAVADPESAASCWLRAKLQLRDGKLDDATKSMARAWEKARDTVSYTGWKGDAATGGDGADAGEYLYYGEGGSFTFPQAAGGDLGGLRLARADFVQSMDALLKGGLWDDAAFVAERVLTADELKAYVDAHPVVSGTVAVQDRGNNGNSSLGYLLGRRLVREDRCDEAAKYLTPPYDKVLQKYVQALKDGADEKLPKSQRAKALFTAAWIARYDGMEIMGTEVSPDGFVTEGAFEEMDIAAERRTGSYKEIKYETVTKNGVQEEVQKTVTHPIALKASKQEQERLSKNRISPDLRFHYRVIAGALAIHAADLMADNSEELADVINTAGNWVKDRDEKVGDRYFLMLKKRCAGTKLGRAALAKRWFIGDSGPWSTEQQAAHDALHKALGIKEEN